MAFISWAMRHAGSAALALAYALTFAGSANGSQTPSACKATVYLTIDTGHMGPAEAMAAILKKHNVNATFFLANEKTELQL